MEPNGGKGVVTEESLRRKLNSDEFRPFLRANHTSATGVIATIRRMRAERAKEEGRTCSEPPNISDVGHVMGRSEDTRACGSAADRTDGRRRQKVREGSSDGSAARSHDETTPVGDVGECPHVLS